MSADTHFTMTGIVVLLAPGDEVGLSISIDIFKLEGPNEKKLFASRVFYINKYKHECKKIK